MCIKLGRWAGRRGRMTDWVWESLRAPAGPVPGARIQRGDAAAGAGARRRPRIQPLRGRLRAPGRARSGSALALWPPLRARAGTSHCKVRFGVRIRAGRAPAARVRRGPPPRARRCSRSGWTRCASSARRWTCSSRRCATSPSPAAAARRGPRAPGLHACLGADAGSACGAAV